MKFLSFLIITNIIVKVVFIGCTIFAMILKHEKKEDSKMYENVVYYKEFSEFLFVVLMAVMLIVLFNPMRKKMIVIGEEERIFLFIFGCVLLTTADWGLFFKPISLKSLVSDFLNHKE